MPHCMTSAKMATSIQIRGLASPAKGEGQAQRQEGQVPNANNNLYTLPGVTPPQGDMLKFRRQPGSVMPGQRRKHLQGSARRGITPAPNLKSTALGMLPAATACDTAVRKP